MLQEESRKNDNENIEYVSDTNENKSLKKEKNEKQSKPNRTIVVAAIIGGVGAISIFALVGGGAFIPVVLSGIAIGALIYGIKKQFFKTGIENTLKQSFKKGDGSDEVKKKIEESQSLNTQNEKKKAYNTNDIMRHAEPQKHKTVPHNSSNVSKSKDGNVSKE